MFAEENLDKKKCQKCQNIIESQKLHAAGEYHTSFQGTNVPHIGPLTEKWRETASLLENTEILFELHTDVRASRLMNCLTTVNA